MNTVTHLILGDPEDFHAAYMKEQLEAKGITVAYWDTRHWNGPNAAALHLKTDLEMPLLTWLDPHTHQSINAAHIKAVFWRCYYEFSQSSNDERVEYMLNRDRGGLVESVFKILAHQGCRFVNGLKAFQMHKTKPYQLYRAHQLGVPIPHTCISNHPQSVQKTVKAGEWIYKPVLGGAHTEAVTEDDLSDERLAELPESPVTFQQRIEGEAIRIVVFPEACYGIRIETDALDYRDDQAAPLVQVPVPNHVQNQCWAILKAFHMMYSGMDFLRQPDGTFVFLEANPAAMFVGFERRSGAPLTQALLTLLTA
ncbi:MAG: hypothetical protein QE263_07025 [Vampirovibrionales bacterium]|nr:hypothetical protein [Vampirovibrionales bacterium]